MPEIDGFMTGEQREVASLKAAKNERWWMNKHNEKRGDTSPAAVKHRADCDAQMERYGREQSLCRVQENEVASPELDKLGAPLEHRLNRLRAEADRRGELDRE